MFVVLVAALLTGCAAASSPMDPVDPQSRRTMLGLMQQLSETQSAHRKTAEARRTVMVALQALEGVEIEVVPYAASDVERWCPAVVRAMGAGEGAAVTEHERRLARALIALDEELVASGHGSAGCRASEGRGDPAH
jgi:hypothetical protein